MSSPKLADRLGAAEPVRVVRRALGEAGDVWLVGGVVRDALLARPLVDVDLAVAGDPEAVARAVASAFKGTAFQLSEAFGGWRAIDPARGWVCDVSPLQAETVEGDLAQRDFTVNAIAVPLAGGDPIDPYGGRGDLAARTLRALPGAYESDPLRTLRLVRLAAELDMTPDADTRHQTRALAPRLREPSGERVFGELKRLLMATHVLDGLELGRELGVMGAVLPELEALQGIEQGRYHHLDVYGHTVEVLRELIALLAPERLEEVFGTAAAPLSGFLAEPLADDLTREQALRFGALFHDVAKPHTRQIVGEGRVGFPGHDTAGDEMVGEIFRRLRTSERLRTHVGALARHHLRLGFLVHERPLSRADVYRYLARCDPVAVDVTVLSVADRLATRGRKAEPAIAAHLELARELIGPALDWQAGGPPQPPIRGDELAAEIGIEPGPGLGELLARLREAVYTGEVTTREEAVELARRERSGPA